jgi:uncharacterized protein (DUF433 family)
MTSEAQPVLQKHVESKPDVCGGRPCVAGTRIRVWDIHVWHDLQGQSPEEIVAVFPQLSLANVHAAVAYYLDHREEIESQMKEAEAFVARMEAEQGPTRFTRLRDKLLKDNEVDDDSVSSG